MADISKIDVRKFTPATELIVTGKLVQDSKTGAYNIDSKALVKDEEILMSKSQFDGGMKNIKGVPVTITPDGLPPKEIDTEYKEIPTQDIKTM